MAYTSPTSINASLGFGEVLHYINDVTNNWVSNLLLLSVYVIILIGFYKAKEDFKGALAVAGYGCFILALLFWIGGFVSGIALGVTIAVAIVGTIVLLLDNN